jgi:hypothetical protein
MTLDSIAAGSLLGSHTNRDITIVVSIDSASDDGRYVKMTLLAQDVHKSNVMFDVDRRWVAACDVTALLL